MPWQRVATIIDGRNVYPAKVFKIYKKEVYKCTCGKYIKHTRQDCPHIQSYKQSNNLPKQIVL